MIKDSLLAFHQSDNNLFKSFFFLNLSEAIELLLHEFHNEKMNVFKFYNL